MKWIFGLVLGLATIGLTELLIVWVLQSPGIIHKLPRRLEHRLENLYAHNIRRIIQFEPAFASYDTAVTYTLRPNMTFRFKNLEFDTEVTTNRLGLRDDEESLKSPEIIVLGDSIAMGWGVERWQTFAHHLRADTGRKVLNAGIPSFGTVRELRLLDRLDRSGLQMLVIQYAGNDVGENAVFWVNGNELPITPEGDYRREADNYRSRIEYFPGKYFYSVLLRPLMPRRKILDPGKEALKRSSLSEAELFLNALAHAGSADLSQVKVLLFQVRGRNEPAGGFVQTVHEAAQTGPYPEWIRAMTTLSIDSALTREHYFELDDHPNETGHRVIADLLLPTIEAELKAQSKTTPKSSPATTK